MTVKRLDKLIDGTTISCGCVKRTRNREWVERQLSLYTPNAKAQIWCDAQVIKRKELREKYDSIDRIVLDAIVREERSRREQNAPTLTPSTVALLRRFREMPDSHYIVTLLSLHDNVTTIGSGPGGRQYPVFNSEELTFKKNGELAGVVAGVLGWAEDPRVREAPGMAELLDWLDAKVAETRQHRKSQRRKYLVKVRAEK